LLSRGCDTGGADAGGADELPFAGRRRVREHGGVRSGSMF
jgi:hypothetical protein